MSQLIPRLKNGDAAPPFELCDVRGDAWKLSDHRGKMVLLLFGRGEYCPTGRAEFARWNSYARLLPKLNCEMVFIVNGGREQHARFIEQARIQRPILLDGDGAVATTYGVYGVNHVEHDYPGYEAPTVTLIDAAGLISAFWIASVPRGCPDPEVLLGILAYAEHNNWKY